MKRVNKRVNARAKQRFVGEVEQSLAGLVRACQALLVPGVDTPDRWLRIQRLARIAGVLSKETASDVAGLVQRHGAGLYVAGQDPIGELEGGGEMALGMAAPVPDNVQLLREMIPALQNIGKPAPPPPREATPWDLSSALTAREALVAKGEPTEEIDAYLAACRASLRRQAETMGKPVEASKEDKPGLSSIEAGMAFGQALGAVAAAGGEQPIGPGAMAGGVPLGPQPE